MPVTKLIVGGFRSLAETIEIPLAPITVLLGPNSAGKSAVKDAMLAMKDAMIKSSDEGTVSSALAKLIMAMGRDDADAHVLSVPDENGEVQTLEVTLGCLVDPFGEHGCTDQHLPGPLGYAGMDSMTLMYSGAVEYVFSEAIAGQRSQVDLTFNTDQVLRYVDGRRIEYELNGVNVDLPDLMLVPKYAGFYMSLGWLRVNLNAYPLKTPDFQALVHRLVEIDSQSIQSDSLGIWWTDGHILNIRCNIEDRKFVNFSERFYKTPEIVSVSESAIHAIQEIFDVLNEMLHQVEWALAQELDMALVSGSRISLTTEDVTTDEMIARPTRGLLYPSAKEGKITSYAEWLGLVTAQPCHLNADDIKKLQEKDDLVNEVLSKELFLGRRYQVKPEVTQRLTRVLVGREPDDDDEAARTLQTTLYLQDQHGRNLDFHQVGSGVSFILPVLTALWGAPRSWIEQPELHLHPAAQCEIGDAVIMAFNRGRFSVIETHSEHMLLRILKRIRQTSQGKVTDPDLRCQPEAIAVLYFDPQDDGTTSVHQLRVTRGGDFMDRWPRGFFEERNAELFDE